MDVATVKDSTDEDLYKLGIRARGDILVLRGYCNRMNLISNISDKLAPKKTLMECITVTGRTDNNKSTAKSKGCVCYIGYMKYSTDVCGYVQLRGRGGGTRQMRFNGTATQATQKEIIEHSFLPPKKIGGEGGGSCF